MGNLPHGRVLLDGLALTPERFRTEGKIAIPIPALKAIISLAVGQLPFDTEFYLQTYPDIRKAYNSGKIPDLKAHFTEVGYFEGRIGSITQFDEEFYKDCYPDVAEAIARGAIKSGLEHYIGSGAFEGRCADAADREAHKHWLELFRPQSRKMSAGP